MSYTNAAAQLWLFYIYIYISWIENGFGQAHMETQWKRKRDRQNIETHQICINVISIKWNARRANNTTMDDIAFRARARPYFKNACAGRNADMNLLWHGISAAPSGNEPNRLTDSLQNETI